MDITFKMENHTLNVRSAAIIIHNNKVLLHKNVNEDDKKIEETLKNVEGKECLEYRWLDLDKINEYKIKRTTYTKSTKMWNV